MTKIETPNAVPGFTRLIWALATLAGVGASLGLGICTLRLGHGFTEYVATNHMSLSARGHLLKWFFLAMLAVPTFFSAITVIRVNDSDRLRTLERMASRVAPLTAIGLWPMLLHNDVWKDRTLLFLAATLTSTLLVWGSLRNLTPWRLPDALRLIARALRAKLPARFFTFLPWFLLVLVVSFVVVRGLNDSMLMHVRLPRDFKGTTVAAGIRYLGHGGVLAVPLVFIAKLRTPLSSAINTFTALTLVAGAALPLYAWAKSRLGSFPAFVVALLYLSFPPLLTVVAKSVLPLGCAALFFFVAAQAWEKRKFALAIVVTLFMLAVHEQSAFWLLCLCVYLARKEPASRLFPVLVLAPIAYFIGIGGWLLPSFGTDPYGEGFHGLWSTPSPGMLSALLTLFKNPVYVLARFSEQRAFTFWFLMLVPFAMMPLRGRLWLLWALPFTWFGIVAIGRFPDPSLSHPSVAHFVVMGFVAAVTALESIRREQGKARVWAALLTWVFAIVPCIYQFGCLWLSPL